MAASRNWCPALSAAPDTLQIGLSNPSKSESPSPSRARPQSPKNKGSKAAALSVTTASNGVKLVDRVRHDRAFSNKIALSLATAEELGSVLSAAGETVDAATYVSHLNPDAAATPGAEGQPLKLSAPLIVRNAAHLTDFLKSNADGTRLQPRNVVISDADLTTDALVGLVDGPIEQVTALTVQRSLQGTNSLAALCTALYGGAPPPEEPEPEAAVDADEQGEEEAPVAKPPKPVWAPKQRSIQFLKLASNAVGFGAAAGEEPSAAAVEELTKLIGQPTVAPIKHLSLSNCYLQSTGGAAVATAVLPSGTIETLDLAGNGIGKGDEGTATQAIAQLVQENKFLTSIDLSGNDFDVAQSKQILEALANSKTRVATPEPNPEPEPEEYTDELPPEEEPPTVEIGFPADKEKEKEQQGEGEEGAPAEEGTTADAAEPEPEAAAPPKAEGGDEGEEGEEEGEEDEEEPKPKPAEPAKKTVKIEEKPEEPAAEVDEDEEAAEERRRREEEKEEAEREAQEAVKAAWAEKQEQYIWGPQRVHAEYGESVSRRVILKAHIDETTQLKSLERASRADAKKRQLHREKEDRERRSGWTHLKVLNFSGNPMGSVGAKAIADAIRKKIPMSEEEIQRAEEAADAFVVKATEAAEAAAAAKAEADKAAEEAAREQAAKEAEEQASAAKEQPIPKKQVAPAPPPPPEDDGDAADENAEGDAEAQEDAGDNSLEDPPAASAEKPQEEEAPQEPEQEEEAPAAEDEPEQDEDGEQAAIAGGAPPTSASAATGIVRPKVEKDRDGIQTLQVLNLGSCGIGSKGLKALSTVLKENNESLKTLILKRNKFGVKHAEVPPPDAKEDDDPPKPMLRIDVTSWVSPGVQALSEALTINRTLTVLDLSYNNMYPVNLALLADGLQKNRTLEVLLLDGNRLNSSSLLLQLIQAIGGEDSAVTTLGLSSGGIEGALTRDVAQALTNCQGLRSLNLDSNGLTAVEASNLSSAIADAPPSFRLRALSLQNNLIHGVEGGVALGNTAKLLSTLHSLRISGNAELGDDAFAELCNLISNHSALKVLSASRTGITTITPLTAVASSIGMLTMVELADNEINTESVIRFAQEVRRMASISFISVWGRTVDIESAAMRDFVEAAKACPTLFQVDLGQGLGAATAPPTPADPSEDPPQTEDDLLSDAEKVEKYCFRNRLLNAVQGQ